MQPWLRLAFWAAVAFTLVMAILPKPPVLPGAPEDKVQHILAFTTLAALSTVAYSRVSAPRMLLGFAAFGALIEIVQMIPILHRDAELLDWIADVAAVLTVFLAVGTWRRLRERA